MHEKEDSTAPEKSANNTAEEKENGDVETSKSEPKENEVAEENATTLNTQNDPNTASDNKVIVATVVCPKCGGVIGICKAKENENQEATNMKKEGDQMTDATNMKKEGDQTTDATNMKKEGDQTTDAACARTMNQNLTNCALVVGGCAAGVVVGAALAPVALSAIGLSTLGPVAGGWFAANMGAGLTAGSSMALIQSAAMTGAATTYCGAMGGAVGVAGTSVYTWATGKADVHNASPENTEGKGNKENATTLNTQNDPNTASDNKVIVTTIICPKCGGMIGVCEAIEKGGETQETDRDA